MTENRVGFLYNIASNLTPNNETLKLLMSYYLMRCKELTKGYGLPTKHFSTKVRCPHCCMEWTRDTEVKVHPLKLSKRQRQRMRLQKRHLLQNNKPNPASGDVLCSNEMEQVCTLCNQTTKTKLIKPQKEYINRTTTIIEHNISKEYSKNKHVTKKESKKTEIKKSKLTITKEKGKNEAAINVYSKAFDVFSLKNENNTISSSIKVPPKLIKNNKKKKDKFAGLCQKAVLSSAKFKQQKASQPQPLQNKLNLFLKPSSG